MRAALDTNLLACAESFGDQARLSATRALLEQLGDADLVVPLPCLGELFRVLSGKAGWPARQGQDAVLRWMDAFPVWRATPPPGAAPWISAWRISWRGVRVGNPLIAPADPLLVQLLG